MNQVLLGNARVVQTHTTNIQDDSETVEFWSGPGRGVEDLLAGVTCVDRPTSPLLVHVPNDVEWGLLNQLLRYAQEWFEQNLPGTKIVNGMP